MTCSRFTEVVESALSVIQVELEQLLVKPELFVARATLLVTNKRGGEDYFFSGCAVGCDQENLVVRARYEIIERLFAMKFITAVSREAVYLPARLFLDDSIDGVVDADAVFISAKTPINRASNNGFVGAAGLAAHPNLEAAKRHGALELLEYHLRTSIWYRGMHLLELGKMRMVTPGWYLSNFTTADYYPVPFVLTVVYSDDGGLFVGSALKPDLIAAVNHSESEALMLLDSFCSGRNGVANTPDSRQRLQTIKTTVGKDCIAYLRSLVIGAGEINSQPWDIQDTLSSLGMGSLRLRYVNLVDTELVKVIRVVSSELLTEILQRNLTPTFYPPDPFC